MVYFDSRLDCTPAYASLDLHWLVVLRSRKASFSAVLSPFICIMFMISTDALKVRSYIHMSKGSNCLRKTTEVAPLA